MWSYIISLSIVYASAISLSLLTALLTVAAAVVLQGDVITNFIN
jgi:hypothetical protein